MKSWTDQARVIPCLLLAGERLVKTERFGKRTYIGDPTNTLAIFNSKEVDEIVVLDIDASRHRRPPNFEKIEEMTSQCFMPLAYGGGITSVDEIRTIIGLGVEKIILNSKGITDPGFVREAAAEFGSQSILVSIDVKKTMFGRYSVRTHGGRRAVRRSLEQVVDDAVSSGAGELLVQSIDRDGTMQGYDLDLTRSITRHVTVPVIACGGAGALSDLALAINEGSASAVAAGSLFVYHGPHKAVLITYPGSDQVRSIVNVRHSGPDE